jgi:hypothetical protein
MTLVLWKNDGNVTGMLLAHVYSPFVHLAADLQQQPHGINFEEASA